MLHEKLNMILELYVLCWQDCLLLWHLWVFKICRYFPISVPLRYLIQCNHIVVNACLCKLNTLLQFIISSFIVYMSRCLITYMYHNIYVLQLFKSIQEEGYQTTSQEEYQWVCLFHCFQYYSKSSLLHELVIMVYTHS